MQRKLLLLGMLRSQKMHGYQLNKFIDSHWETTVHLKRPTAYYLLEKMAQDGWVTYKEERKGNRPQRRVYAITPQGEAAFQRLLRESLGDYKPSEFHSDIGLAFVDAIPPRQVIFLLQKRRSAIKSLLQTLRTTQSLHRDSLKLLIEHRISDLSAELKWLDEVIARTKTS